MKESRTVAYFSMEVGFSSEIPTYSGGLGILAGDTLRSAADLGVPIVGVTLVHRRGYFHQRLAPDGQQSEEPEHWSVDDFLEPVEVRSAVNIEGRTVHVTAWRFELVGVKDARVPIYFLDTDLPENAEWDRRLTHFLYGDDAHYRLCQEVVLGIGGLRVLEALGYDSIQRFHMNEGHASLLALELLEQQANLSGRSAPNLKDIQEVRRKCVFTTHTPVQAGHDQFPMDLVHRVLGDHAAFSMKEVFCCDGVLNMTYLALNLSHYVNGVAKRHREISQQMFARYQIDSITNGVHAASWTSPHMQVLFDRYIDGWREDNAMLRYALNISPTELWNCHQKAKSELLHAANRSTNAGLDQDVLTLGFARRATSYKRPDLLLQDVERLRQLSKQVGAIQIVYAGKAHPHDEEGKAIIRHIFAVRKSLGEDVRMAYVENYDIDIAKLYTSGVDVWVNTPQPPMEASGTSGMKAALNGVPSLSVLDGWWLEGCIDRLTGWPIGNDGHGAQSKRNDAEDALCLYDQLENAIIPMYYSDRDKLIDAMRHTIALNGAFFNTQRMMQQYVLKAYF